MVVCPSLNGVISSSGRDGLDQSSIKYKKHSFRDFVRRNHKIACQNRLISNFFQKLESLRVRAQRRQILVFVALQGLYLIFNMFSQIWYSGDRR